MFIQCARRVRPDAALTLDDQRVIETICRLVDGMPLAIELAAGWAGAFALTDIQSELERGLDLLATDLRDVPSRHRSIRAVFDSSYQRLDRAEQLIVARLAVFRGSFALEAVQVVTQATRPQLQRLVDVSLLSYDAGSGRYTTGNCSAMRNCSASVLASRVFPTPDRPTSLTVPFSCWRMARILDMPAMTLNSALVLPLSSNRRTRSSRRYSDPTESFGASHAE